MLFLEKVLFAYKIHFIRFVKEEFNVSLLAAKNFAEALIGMVSDLSDEHRSKMQTYMENYIADAIGDLKGGRFASAMEIVDSMQEYKHSDIAMADHWLFANFIAWMNEHYSEKLIPVNMDEAVAIRKGVLSSRQAVEF